MYEGKKMKTSGNVSDSREYSPSGRLQRKVYEIPPE